MWSVEVLGTDVYHLVAAFVAYSMLGWLVESIYMSFCNRKITNRGFAKGPFCPIYGFGGTFGYLILSPLAGQYVKLYFAGAILATIFEFFVGKMMIRLLGKLWWDYNDKPFNYKGILCLESTIAWGFYALGIVGFLHGKLIQLIDLIDVQIGSSIILIILSIIFVDYVIQLCQSFNIDLKEKKEMILDKVNFFKIS